MRVVYLKIELTFERLTSIATKILGNSLTFIMALIELKINELISSHDGANNSVMDTGGKTENEIRILSKEYTELDESEKVIVEEFIKGQHE